MAAIYAFLPLTRIYLTSKPYPLYGEDAVDEEHDLIGAYGVYWHPENFNETMESLGGTLVQTIWYYAYDVGGDDLNETMEFIEGTLIQTIGYYEYDLGLENLNEDMQFISGTLIKVIGYITIEQPPDNVVEEFEIISGFSVPV